MYRTAHLQPSRGINHGTNNVKPAKDSFEPVYNVLEEPDQEPLENPNYFGSILSEQPVYNTLQSPFGSGEDPECINEAIYNTLEETSPPNFEAEDEV